MKRIGLAVFALLFWPWTAVAEDDPILEINDYWFKHESVRIDRAVEDDVSLRVAAGLMKKLNALTVEQQRIRIRFVRSNPGLKGSIMLGVGLNFVPIALPEKENQRIEEQDDDAVCRKQIHEVLAAIDDVDADYKRLSVAMAGLAEDGSDEKYREFVSERLKTALEQHPYQLPPD